MVESAELGRISTSLFPPPWCLITTSLLFFLFVCYFLFQLFDSAHFAQGLSNWCAGEGVRRERVSGFCVPDSSLVRVSQSFYNCSALHGNISAKTQIFICISPSPRLAPSLTSYILSPHLHTVWFPAATSGSGLSSRPACGVCLGRRSALTCI